MGNFDNIDEELTNPVMEEEEQEESLFEVELVTLSGVKKHEVREGQTIAEFKDAMGLARNTKVVDEDGDVLRNEDIIDNDMTLYISAPKKNG